MADVKREGRTEGGEVIAAARPGEVSREALARTEDNHDVLVRDVRYLTDQEIARERLKNSIDALTQQASLQVQLQKEPLKMLGGASAVGAVLGLVVGRQFKKTKRVYVDAGSPVKYQKELIRAQNKQKQSVGGALAATLGTLAFKTLMDRVITPRIDEITHSLLEKAGQAPATTGTAPAPASASPKPPAALRTPAPVAPVQLPTTPPSATPAVVGQPSGTVGPVSSGGVSSFVKPVHVGVIAPPESHVDAKAVGTPIDEAQKANPNLR